MQRRRRFLVSRRAVLSSSAPEAPLAALVRVRRIKADPVVLVPEALVAPVAPAHAVPCIPHAPTPAARPLVVPVHVLALPALAAVLALVRVPALAPRVPEAQVVW
jgi:hypothetical protein